MIFNYLTSARLLDLIQVLCVGSVGRIVITYSQGGNRFGGDLKLVEVVGLIRDLKYERQHQHVL